MTDTGDAIDEFKRLFMRDMIKPWAAPVCRWLARILERVTPHQ